MTECGGVAPRTGSREVDVVASPNDDRRKKEDVSEISARAQASPSDADISRANVICSRVVLFSHYLFNVSRLFSHYSSNIVRLFCRYFARLFIVNRQIIVGSVKYLSKTVSNISLCSRRVNGSD